jgi:hypothetical protein
MARILMTFRRWAFAALLALAPAASFAQPPKPAYVTGSPTTGALAKASGPQSVTTGDLSGDCTTSATLAVICLKTNGVSFGSFATGTDAANLTGTLGCARLPALTGDVTTSAGSCATTIGAHKVTLGDIAQIGANTLLGNATASTANVAAQSMPSCSAASSALTWTTSSGFGCNTISGGTGTVTTTGSPASGNLAKFSGSTSVTSGDMSGDCATSGTLSLTCSLPVGHISAIAANTVAGNATGSSAAPTALSVPSCSGATNALIWTSSTGFGCNTIAGGASGAVTLVSTQTVSGVSQVSFAVSAGFDYKIVGSNVRIASGTPSLIIQAGTGGRANMGHWARTTSGQRSAHRYGTGNAVTSMSLVGEFAG